MYSRLALIVLPMITNCISGSDQRLPGIVAKSRVELSPTFISCGLNDIAIIPAPVVDAKAIYQLYKPNSEIIELDIPRRGNRTRAENAIKDTEKTGKSTYTVENNRVITRHSSNEDVNNAGQNMRGNEFMIGPMQEEDNGNWVLSVYFKDLDDKWTEMFQVITVEIVESVPVVPSRPKLRRGDSLHLSFAYPIKHLQSCELTAPSTTYDRFYNRTRIDLNRCGYIVGNVTREDEGAWKITGVGKIVYEGRAILQVV